jgi:hypothetical protein
MTTTATPTLPDGLADVPEPLAGPVAFDIVNQFGGVVMTGSDPDATQAEATIRRVWARGYGIVPRNQAAVDVIAQVTA